jgi:hypothetical protein
MRQSKIVKGSGIMVLTTASIRYFNPENQGYAGGQPDSIGV